MFAKFKKASSILSKNLNRKSLNRYAFFFFISLSFWFLTMLSKIHETTLYIPIKYKNYPANLIELSSPADFIDVRVKATGVSILSFHLFNLKSLILNYDFANSQPLNNGESLFWIMNSYRKEFSYILGASIEIMDITPNRLIIPFVKKKKKEVPVILNSSINLMPTYWLASDVKINPSKVTVYGDQQLLDSISSISTDLLTLHNLRDSYASELALIIPDGLTCLNDSILVELRAEPFIEEVLRKKVEVRNLESSYAVKLFPSHVSVTLRMPKDKYSILKTNFIRIYIDASKLEENKMAIIEHDILPEMVKLERIYPDHLEFLLIKE